MTSRKSRPVARALYLTRGQNEHELSFSPGEAILLLRRVDENWLEGELDGKVGIFPANRVQIEIGSPSSSHESAIARSGRPYGVALYSFDGDHAGDLRFEKGEMVELLGSVGGGWTRGRIEGRTGIFPSSFVQVFQPLATSTTNSHPKPRRHLSSEEKPEDKPRPRIRRMTEPVKVTQRLESREVKSSTNLPRSRPVSSRSYRTVKTASSIQATTTRRRSSLASVDQQISSLQSSLHVEQKMLKSAKTLLKLTSVPEKQEKLAQAVANHERNISNMETEIAEIEAERSTIVARSAPATPPSPRSTSADIKLQQDVQRKKVLQEIVETEMSFCHEMEVFCEKVLPAFKQWSEVKWEDLFGNIEELVEISSKLSVSLQEVRSEDSWTEGSNVGTVLQQYAPQLRKVYGPYCRSHDYASQLLEKLTEDTSKNEKIRELLQLGRPELQAWDTQSLLIKPIQRVLQYPLLLDKLLKTTPVDHTHHKSLVSALSSLNQVAQDINEFKRRKDIVDRYTGASRLERNDRSLLYSMKKKARRLQQNITQLTGLRSATTDPMFDEEEQRILAMESCLQSLLRNTTSWKEETEHLLACRENLVEAMTLYSSESSQVLQAQKYMESTASAWKQHWLVLKDQLIEPLQQTLGLFRNPLLLVAKRKDKLLDYDSLRHDLDKMTDPEHLQQLKEQCSLAKRTYEALNAQLLEELPRFTARVAAVVAHLLGVFVRLQDTWHRKVLELLSNGSTPTSAESFISAHAHSLAVVCQQLSALYIVPVTLSASFIGHRLGVATTPPVSPRQERSLPFIADVSPLSVTSRTTKSLDDLDKIDGANEYEELRANYSQKEIEHIYSQLETDHTHSQQETDHTCNTPSSSEETLEAVYDFIAESSWELSVMTGQRVKLVCPQDTSGCRDWWLVRDESGQEGYVAASYLGYSHIEDSGYS